MDGWTISPKNLQLDNCCVFRPAFGCCAHLKAGCNTFFQPFSPFFVYFKPFPVISWLKSTKNDEKEQKTCFFIFCLILKTGRHEKAGRLFSFFVSFRLISVFFRKFIQTKSKDYSFTLLAKNVVWAYLWVDAHYPSLSPLSPTWAYQRFLCHLFEVKKDNAFHLGEGGGGLGY